MGSIPELLLTTLMWLQQSQDASTGAAVNTGTFRAACLELHSGQKMFGKPHLSAVSYQKGDQKDQLEVLLPLSNKCANRNKVLRINIYVIGKWKLKDLRDFSVRKDMLAAGVALRLPAYILPLRWSRKPTYQTLPHHCSDSNKVNMFWISPRILSLLVRRQINSHKVIWERKKWAQ